MSDCWNCDDQIYLKEADWEMEGAPWMSHGYRERKGFQIVMCPVCASECIQCGAVITKTNIEDNAPVRCSESERVWCDELCVARWFGNDEQNHLSAYDRAEITLDALSTYHRGPEVDREIRRETVEGIHEVVVMCTRRLMAAHLSLVKEIKRNEAS